METYTHDDKEKHNDQHVRGDDVDINNDPLSKLEGESHMPDLEIVINNTNDDSETRNNRLLAGMAENKTELGPVIGYAEEPISSLAEACAPLDDLLHDITFYIQMAINETPEKPPDGLTIDESAAIRLYTIEWEKPHYSLYSMLNYTLKNSPRDELRPYFRYLKLFLTALAKLPCVPPTTVWRGVTKDLSAEFPRGTLITWWAFSSCTTELTVLENNMYLGTTGERTLFSVEAINGRTIRAHSHFITEDEILLLPGTHMEVQSLFSPASDLHIVHLKQIKPVETLYSNFHMKVYLTYQSIHLYV